MNSESELILSLARQVVSPGNKEFSEKLADLKAINWQRFRELIRYHELTLCLYSLVKDHLYVLAQDFQDSLKISCRDNYAWELRLWNEFLPILEGSQKANIGLVPIKGIALLKDIYNLKPLRMLADIDLLVRKDELKKAEFILQDLGFVKNLEGLREEYWLENQCHLPFVKNNPKSEPVFLDLHFGLDFKRDKVDILPKIWERLRVIGIGNVKMKLLSPEDTFFSLTLHNRRFGNPLRLKYVIDMVLLLKKYQQTFDWGYVLEESRAGRMSLLVFFALSQLKLLSAGCLSIDLDRKLKVKGWKRKAVYHFIRKNTFSDSLYDKSGPFTLMMPKVKKLYLKSHFFLYDTLGESVRYILNIPKEQFAKYYCLKPYEKKTDFFYKNRLLFMLFKTLF